MGISGLLQGLKPFTETRNIREFSNQALAIDASSWLHKSVYSIADLYVEAMEDRDRHCRDTKCIETSAQYIVKRCEELLLYARIARLYLVLDGKRCPLKAPTNQDREQKRQRALAEARAHRHSGSNQNKMFEKYKTCIKITAEFTKVVIDRASKLLCHHKKVHFIQSPYEADAQLVDLCVTGMAQAIVTEDSDVLVYSAACRFSFPVLFKLDRNSGECQVLSMSWLLDPQCRRKLTLFYQGSAAKSVTALEFILIDWMNDEQRHPGKGARLFVQACVLAGCDYAPSQLSGVGLVNAFKMVDRNRSVAHSQRFRLLLRHHKSTSSSRRQMPNMEDYETLLSQAEAVFYYHPVRKEYLQKVSYLNALRPDDDELPSLDRFGLELDFLGCVSNLSFDSQVNKNSNPHSFVLLKAIPSASPPHPPVAEIVIREGRKRKRPDGSPSPTFRREFVPMENPYSKQRSESNKPQQQHRQPLRSLSPNVQLPKRWNPFEMHRHSSSEGGNVEEAVAPAEERSNEKESICNNALSSKALSFARPNRGSSKLRDVRFVKPKFAKDGTRVEQQPKLQQGLATSASATALPLSSRFTVTANVAGRQVDREVDDLGSAKHYGGACVERHDDAGGSSLSFLKTSSQLDDGRVSPGRCGEHLEFNNASNSIENITFDYGARPASPDIDECFRTKTCSEYVPNALEVRSVAPNLAHDTVLVDNLEPDLEDFAKQSPSGFPGDEGDLPLPEVMEQRHSDIDNNTASKYFFGGDSHSRHLSRRVTLEEDQQKQTYECDHNQTPGQHPIFHVSLPRSSGFDDLYDEFFSPKKSAALTIGEEDAEDEIEDDSPGFIAPQQVRDIEFNSKPPPKPRSSIGPAKTMRFRFGGGGANSKPKQLSLVDAFQRQEEQADFGFKQTSHSDDNNTSRRPFQSDTKQQPPFAHRRRAASKPSNTLFSYFGASKK
ncbi:hypothetical protein ACA910_009697 [Epithemia clementina (nom. ined.)]